MQLLGRTNNARPLLSRRHGPLVVVFLVGTVSIFLSSGFSLLFVGGFRLVERFGLHSIVASRRPLPSSVPRNLFTNSIFNPAVFQREEFVSKQLERMRLAIKKGGKVRAVDVEPIDPRYWMYLQPVGAAWSVETIYALVLPSKTEEGKKLEEVQGKDMKTAADAQKSTLMYPQWDGKRAKLPDGSVHCAMFSDDAFTRIGKKKIGPALREVHRILKKKGRVFIIATEEDEKALGYKLNLGDADALEEYGFELRSASRNNNVERVVACLTKLEKGAERLKVKVDAKDIASALFD